MIAKSSVKFDPKFYQATSPTTATAATAAATTTSQGNRYVKQSFGRYVAGNCGNQSFPEMPWHLQKLIAIKKHKLLLIV